MDNQTIFLRMKTEKNISKLSRFSFLKGMKQILQNFSLFFTGTLLSGGSGGWIEEKSENSIIDDVSLVIEDGEPKFINTPVGNKTILMELTKTIKD